MSLVGLPNGIRSEDVLSDEKKSWRKDGDAINVYDFAGSVWELWKIIWCFELKGIAVADSHWDEDDWGRSWAERKFDLVKEDGGDNLIKDDCDKYEDDDWDDCSDNTSCNVSITDFENFIFPFSIRWKWSLLYSSMFRELSGKVQSGSWRMKVTFFFFFFLKNYLR